MSKSVEEKLAKLMEKHERFFSAFEEVFPLAYAGVLIAVGNMIAPEMTSASQVDDSYIVFIAYLCETFWLLSNCISTNFFKNIRFGWLPSAIITGVPTLMIAVLYSALYIMLNEWLIAFINMVIAIFYIYAEPKYSKIIDRKKRLAARLIFMIVFPLLFYWVFCKVAAYIDIETIGTIIESLRAILWSEACGWDWTFIVYASSIVVAAIAADRLSW